MADNTVLNAGSGGDIIATDDISGVKFQRVKVVLGGDGVNDGDISSTNPVPVTGALTDTQLRATPVPISGTVSTGLSQPVTDAQIRATPLPISGTVTANTGLTQPLTDTQLRATPVPISGTVNTGLSQPLTDAQLRATSVPVNTGLTQPLTDAQIRATALPIAGGITNYLFSAAGANSTITNLAAGATFTGTIEAITSYQDISFLAYADQNLTITINQFIDAAGDKLVDQRIYSYLALDRLAESFPINGNYLQVIATNNGGSTTTVLDINTAYGTMSPTNELKDDYIRGQSAQTATVNNILTPVAGTAPTDVIKFRSFACQVVSTGTAGTFIFEGSNDGTNFQAVPVFNQALVVKVPIVTAITASASQIIYEGVCNFRYLRLRIATTITGGSIQAHTIFGHNPQAQTVQLVANGTAANLLATVSGTVTATVASTTITAGQTAHSSASTGAPLRVAGRVVPTTIANQDVTLVAGDASDVGITSAQQLIIKEGATAELDFTVPVSSAATVVTVQGLIASPAQASVRNYIKSIRVANDALGAAGNLWLLDSIVSVTSIAITTGLVTTGTHDLRVGDAIVFTALAGGTGVTANQIYYVTTVGSATTFNFSATVGGANVVPSVAYTGTSMYRVFDQIRLQTTAGERTFDYNQPLRGIANTITNFLIPTSLTSGTIYITANGYRGF